MSDLIGHTPLLQLHKLDTGPCSLFLKLENQNPGGSIKDRVALSMINEAERQGKLRPGERLSKPPPAIPASVWR
ncbi:Cystathionine beta-synthase [Klebsiella pneumoniae ISC21]|nr:Cystathionine beta-synthase [Klebsiella pneumoniae ISC21]